MENNIGKKGFVAITSVIIISVVLMVLIFTVNYGSFLNRFNILDTTSKKTSRALAESCVADARLKMILDPLYAGDEIIPLGSYTCKTFPIEDNLPGLQKTIKTEANVDGAETNLKVIISLAGFEVVSWEELADLP